MKPVPDALIAAIRHRIDVGTADLPDRLTRAQVVTLTSLTALSTAADALENPVLIHDVARRAEFVAGARAVVAQLIADLTEETS